MRIDFDHGLVEKDGPSVGIGMQNAATNNLWEFFFTGGTANYTIGGVIVALKALGLLAA